MEVCTTDASRGMKKLRMLSKLMEERTVLRMLAECLKELRMLNKCMGGRPEDASRVDEGTADGGGYYGC
jgi:hypothetical protein